MADITVKLSDTQTKCLEYATYSIQDWCDNAIHERARVAQEEIIAKLDIFFEQINNFPLWLQGLIVGGYSTVLGIKGVSTFKKK